MAESDTYVKRVRRVSARMGGEESIAMVRLLFP
jgi:hypothetical protein